MSTTIQDLSSLGVVWICKRCGVITSGRNFDKEARTRHEQYHVDSDKRRAK